MNRKIIGSILGGLWGIGMASLHFRDALMKRFGLNTNFAFSELGGIYENIGVFVVALFAALFGVFIACYMMKEKVIKVGVLTILAECFFVTGFYVFIVMVTVALSGADLSALDIDAIRGQMISLFVLFGGFLLSIFVGGVGGIFLCKHIIEKLNDAGEKPQITSRKTLFNYLDFYFARRARSFFSIMIFFWGAYWLIFNVPNILLYIKWNLIGPWFVLFHPVLWWVAFLWFVAIPIGSLIFVLLPLTMLFPLLYLHWTYCIGVSSMKKVAKVIYILLFFLALGPICTILEGVGKLPINIAVGVVSSRGQKVWEILLDKYTRPLAYEERYEYLNKEGREPEAKIMLNKAIEANFDLGVDALRGQDLNRAERIFEKVLKLSNNNELMERKIAFSYFDYEAIYEAIELLESLHSKHPDDLEIMQYLSDSYLEIEEEEKAAVIMKKAYEARKSEMSEEERIDFLQWIKELEGANIQ